MKRRPINLDFTTIHFPVTAWVSILHRLSGFFIFALIPLLLWMLQTSLASEARFIGLHHQLRQPIVLAIIWLFLSAIFYHLVAGLRHLLLDAHIGESKKEAHYSAFATLLISVLGSLLLGYWLW